MEIKQISEIITKIKSIQEIKEGPIIVAIDGVGGSGKTTLAEALIKNLKNTIIVQLDDFYSPVLKKPDLKRLENQVLIPLRNGQKAKFQLYEWKTNALSDWKIILPEGIIVVEGVFSLDKELINYYDLKIWVEYPSELGFERGVQRDIKKDGVDSSEKWKDVWMPQEEKYKNEQEPEKKADYIIDGTSS